LDYIYKFSILNNIIFISSQSLKLRNLLKQIPYLKNEYYALYFDFKSINKPGFDNDQDLFKYFPLLNNNHIKIINISDYFPIIERNNLLTFDKLGCVISNKIIIEDIKLKFNLPDNLVFIAPFTEDNRIDCIRCNKIHTFSNKKNCKLTRNFIDYDYLNTIDFLKNNNLIGVIISSTHIDIPSDVDKKLFINLSKSTTLLEAIEILKISKYYIGIDSLFSIIASKILGKNNIFIKSNNKHLYKWKHVYYLPNSVNISSFITFK
jgi:ADP-heptose:LPS heptosyltransferase